MTLTFPFAPHLTFIFLYWVNIDSTLRIFHTDAVGSTRKTLDTIIQVDANCLIGNPSYIYHLLRKAQERKTDLSFVKMILMSGEKLTRSARGRIEEMLKERGAVDPQIFDVYSATEMRDAYPECKPGSGVYHIHPHLHICEIVDQDTGKQKKPGESGALAVTYIDGRGTVVCRYLMGDMFEGGIQYGTCPHCGREGPRLVGPIGRIRDHSRSIDMTKVDLNVFYDLMPTIKGVDEWQISLEKRNNDPSDLDILKINVAGKKGVKKADLEKEIKDKIKDALGIDPVVDTHFKMNELFKKMGPKISVLRIVDNRPGS